MLFDMQKIAFDILFKYLLANQVQETHTRSEMMFNFAA